MWVTWLILCFIGVVYLATEGKWGTLATLAVIAFLAFTGLWMAVWMLPVALIKWAMSSATLQWVILGLGVAVMIVRVLVNKYRPNWFKKTARGEDANG